MRETLKTLPINAPAGTLVLVVEDDHTITLTRTRSEPWPLSLLGPRGERQVYVVMLARRKGGYALSRCFIPPLMVPKGSSVVDEILAERAAVDQDVEL